jgi:hypothetical protein
MKDYNTFYFEGCALVELEKNSTTTRLGEVCKDLMMLETLHEPFTWDKKYQNTVDIRPNVYDYDDVFVDFIKDNDLLKSVRRLSQRDMVPYHVQVRKSYPGPSYMDWHRDTYINQDGKVIGMSPGGLKIIFYPMCGNRSSSRLDLLKGTHICHIKNSAADHGIIQSGMFEKLTINSNDNKCVIFDVASLHRVVPDIDTPSIRLIYSFVTRDQFNDMNLDGTIHKTFFEKFNV